MENKIDVAIEYYTFKSNEILNLVNSNNNSTSEQIIENGKQLSILEYKITALEVAKEN